MTQEQKQLLLKDLCARLPYGVKVDHFGVIRELLGVIPPYFPSENIMVGYDINDYEDSVIEDIKPYLRPMSSITEEEKMKAQRLGVCYDWAFHNDIYDIGISMEEAFTAISYLLERHFDINYLIEKGLALEAPEKMYKTE